MGSTGFVKDCVGDGGISQCFVIFVFRCRTQRLVPRPCLVAWFQGSALEPTESQALPAIPISRLLDRSDRL